MVPSFGESNEEAKIRMSFEKFNGRRFRLVFGYSGQMASVRVDDVCVITNVDAYSSDSNSFVYEILSDGSVSVGWN